jgi:hypothetical protein
MNQNKQYFYIDLNIITKQVISWGVSSTATHTGETSDKNVHRIFLTKGQYNKLLARLP